MHQRGRFASRLGAVQRVGLRPPSLSQRSSSGLGLLEANWDDGNCPIARMSMVREQVATNLTVKPMSLSLG